MEFYKLLNATIGSSFEALFAGRTPKIKPIDPEMIIVESVVVIPTDEGSGVIIDKRKTPDNPVVVPINPPRLAKTRDSKRAKNGVGFYFENEPISASCSRTNIFYTLYAWT